jgi:hypothetical protein
MAVTKGGDEARAELRDPGMAGVELQLFRGQEFANDRRRAQPTTS